MTTNRIETLVDGIFAIAMTLLVLSIDVPEIRGPLSEIDFFHRLGAVGPKLLIYALSFWILAGFWRVNHQQFAHIVRCDSRLISINIFWLLLIVLVPFSSELVGEYGEYFTANAVFHLNLFCAASLYSLHWRHARKAGLVDPELDPLLAQEMQRANLIFPALALVALSLAWFVHGWSSLVYLGTRLYRRGRKMRLGMGEAGR